MTAIVPINNSNPNTFRVFGQSYSRIHLNKLNSVLNFNRHFINSTDSYI